MKAILLLLTTLYTAFLSSQETRVMTYNIKYDNTNDTVNNWNDRKEALIDLIMHYRASIVGTQEVLHRQLTYIDSCLTDFAYIGVGRDDGKQKGEYAAIFYDSTRYKVRGQGTFWLSETPDKVSTGWDAALERICTYGLFEEKRSGKKLYVFNAHFDHVGTVAREKSAELIVQKMYGINRQDIPVILMGDLNLVPEETPIQFLKTRLSDGQKIAQRPFYGPNGTFNGFDPKAKLDRRIDYIFVKGLTIKSYVHIDDRMENSKYISDHLPVLIIITDQIGKE